MKVLHLPLLAVSVLVLFTTGLASSRFKAQVFPGSDFRERSCAENALSLEDLNRVEDPSRYAPGEFSQWALTRASKPRGVALVVHGLNTKPSAMGLIVKVLQDSGFDVLRLSLTGHRGDLEEFKSVSRERWLAESFVGYCLAQDRARIQGVPTILVGFSLGALIAEDLMNLTMKQTVEFQKAVLFAPAVSVNSKTHLIKLLRPLGDRHVVESRNLAEYRANWGTPMAGYNALFESLEELESAEFARSNIPTLVFVDPEDELVDAAGLEALKRDRGLSGWTILNVSNAGSELPRKYHHLVIDDRVVGKAQWEKMVSRMKTHLE